MATMSLKHTMLLHRFCRLFKGTQTVIYNDCSGSIARYPCSYSALRFYSSQTLESSEQDAESYEIEEESEREIEMKRDISGLSRRNKAKLFHRFDSAELQPSERDYNPKFLLRRNRRLYARYGSASGVNPAIMWPTKEEILESMEDEQEWEPSLEEMLAKVEAEKAEKIAYKKDREAKVLKSMERMPELIKQYEAKIAKKIDERTKQEQKRKLLMEEAREYFGYDIDPRDEKFKTMQEEKAKQEKDEAKKRKKAEKLAKTTARLISSAAEGH